MMMISPSRNSGAVQDQRHAALPECLLHARGPVAGPVGAHLGAAKSVGGMAGIVQECGHHFLSGIPEECDTEFRIHGAFAAENAGIVHAGVHLGRAIPVDEATVERHAAIIAPAGLQGHGLQGLVRRLGCSQTGIQRTLNVVRGGAVQPVGL